MQAGQQMKIRMPVDMKHWLEQEAARNLRSVTAEIVFSLRERMEKAQAATGEKFGDRAPAAVNHSTALASGPATHG